MMNHIPDEVRRSLLEITDAVQYRNTIDTSGGGYMDAVESRARVTSTGRRRRMKPVDDPTQPPRTTTISFNFGNGDNSGVGPPPPASSTADNTTTPRKVRQKRKEEEDSSGQPSVKITVKERKASPKKRAESIRKESKARNEEMTKDADKLVKFTDVVSSMTVSGETSRQKVKKLKAFEKGTSDITKIMGTDIPLEVASRIARKSRSDFLNSRKTKPQAQNSKITALLDTRTIVMTLLKEALRRYNDYVSEEIIDNWVSKYIKIKMIKMKQILMPN
jgi:hypothetical protein